jgi:hypothetical protein
MWRAISEKSSFLQWVAVDDQALTLTDSSEIGVIVNANSRQNRRDPKRAGRLRKAVGQRAKLIVTDDVSQLPAALESLLAAGTRLWVCDGGDGALHWLLREAAKVLAKPEHRALGRRMPVILPCSGGTMNVVCHAAGLAGRSEHQLSRLQKMADQKQPFGLQSLDSMQIELHGPSGDETVFGFAAAAGGVGQRFFGWLEGKERSASRVASLLGLSATSWALDRLGVAGLFGDTVRDCGREIFAPTRARVTVDGQTFCRTALTGINIASLPVSFGAVMRVFPRAAERGYMQALYGDPSPSKLIGSIPLGVVGKTPSGDAINDVLCREMVVEATSDELLCPVIDGDAYPDIERVVFRVGEPIVVPRF